MDKSKKDKSNKVKSFFNRLVEKIDREMKEKAKSSGCCCNDTENKSSCSK